MDGKCTELAVDLRNSHQTSGMRSLASVVRSTIVMDAGISGQWPPLNCCSPSRSRSDRKPIGAMGRVQKKYLQRPYFSPAAAWSSMSKRRTARTSRSASPNWLMPRMRADVRTTRPSSESHHPRWRPSRSTTWVIVSSPRRLAITRASRRAYLPRGKSRARSATVSPAGLLRVHRWPAGRGASTLRNDG